MYFLTTWQISPPMKWIPQWQVDRCCLFLPYVLGFSRRCLCFQLRIPHPFFSIPRYPPSPLCLNKPWSIPFPHICFLNKKLVILRHHPFVAQYTIYDGIGDKNIPSAANPSILRHSRSPSWTNRPRSSPFICLFLPSIKTGTTVVVYLTVSVKEGNEPRIGSRVRIWYDIYIHTYIYDAFSQFYRKSGSWQLRATKIEILYIGCHFNPRPNFQFCGRN